MVVDEPHNPTRRAGSPTPRLPVTRFEAGTPTTRPLRAGAHSYLVKGGQSMASLDPSDIATRGDALVCRSAVQLLRARRKAGVAGEDWVPDVDRLLSAAGRELETNPESIPTTLRRAAVQLAEHLVQRSSIPIPRYDVGDEPVEHPKPTRGESNGTDHESGVPFAQSIRLGRMG
jgi:hypothetical protein